MCYATPSHTELHLKCPLCLQIISLTMAASV
jgi:hypothetical protein